MHMDFTLGDMQVGISCLYKLSQMCDSCTLKVNCAHSLYGQKTYILIDDTTITSDQNKTFIFIAGYKLMDHKRYEYMMKELSF
jgi:hypothetical protein